VRKYNGGAMGAQLAITDTTTTSSYAVCLIDCNYTGSSWKYGLILVGNNNVTFVTSAMSQSYIGMPTNSQPLWARSFSNGFNCLIKSGSNYKVHQITINSSGSWVDAGDLTVAGMTESFNVADYNYVEGFIYYWSSTSHALKKFYISSSANPIVPTVVYTDPDGVRTCNQIYYNVSEQKIYFTLSEDTLRSVTSAPVLSVVYGGSIGQSYHSIVLHGSVLAGIEASGMVWIQSATAIRSYIKDFDYSGQKITDVINGFLKAYNFVNVIRPDKTAIVYRRGDDSGTPITSGNSLALTIRESSEILRQTNYASGILFAEIGSDANRRTYDGTHYDVEVLSDARTLTLTADFAPVDLYQDLLHMHFAYWSIARDLYTLDAGIHPAFQFEPIDAASVTFATTKIQKTGSGPIYSMIYNTDGSMEVGVLL